MIAYSETKCTNPALLVFLLKIYLIFNYACDCVCACAHEWSDWKPDKGIRSVGAGVAGSCELPDVGSGN